MGCVRESVLTLLSNPAIAAACVMLGLIGVAAEFLRPGRVIPAVIGGVLLVLGLWSLLPQHTSLALAVLAATLPVDALLFYFAARARRNKISMR